MPRPGEIPEQEAEHVLTKGMPWLNDALGRGFAAGSVHLWSGDAGVGKSTLALQALGDLAKQGVKTLYLANEQSLSDVEQALNRVCSERGRLPTAIKQNFHMDDRVSDPKILPEFLQKEVLEQGGLYQGCRAIVLDSIHGRGLSSGANAAYQSLYRFSERAKSCGLVTILIGHVTKAGGIAGPKTLQHNVDTIFHMQRAFRQRPLFVPKNRFGPASLEPIPLEMDKKGRVIRSKQAVASTASVYGFTGFYNQFADVQAMVCFPQFGSSAVFNAPGLPKPKIRQLIRVVGSLEGVGLGELSHEINAYIPGRKVYCEELDLPLAVSLLSSYLQRPVPRDSLFIGELDLMRRVRPPRLGVEERLVSTLRNNQQGAIRNLYVADQVAGRLAQQACHGRRLGDLVDVRGVSDLDAVVRNLWPSIL